MNRRYLLIVGFGILILFLIQSAGILVEAIYILNLMNTSLDARALGVLFFFTPILLFLFPRSAPRWFVWLALVLLIFGRAAAPYLGTANRMLAAGVATGAAMVLLPITLSRMRDVVKDGAVLVPAQGLALCVGLSILLRTISYTLDLSLTAGGGWVGWLLSGLLVYVFIQLPIERKSSAPRSTKGVTTAAVGCMAVINLMYFVFTSPGVIARWTEGNYQLIIVATSLLSLLWLFLSLSIPERLMRIKPGWLLVWNILFTLALTGTILAHTVRFPANTGAPVVVVSAPAWYQQIPLVLLLLTFPVLFFDFALFSGLIIQVAPPSRRLATGFLLGALILVVAVFMVIFTNVWGYVEPVSTPFRNQFWLPHFLLAAVITLLFLVLSRRVILPGFHTSSRSSTGWIGVILSMILLATAVAALLTDRIKSSPADGNTLKVMTYNIQQANDAYGEKSYERQLELVRQVDPDILGLQESDSARVSLNNNDIVRYLASHLGYYTYYGPKTVTGTYGTALLSKYPLENVISFFSYSDQDEVGSVQAEIQVGDERIAIFNVHPDGSDTAMSAFANALLLRAADSTRVISIGDYNLRESEEAYQMIDAAYKNAWMDVYPTGIGADGTDMSGDKRIDHIFISPEMMVSDPVYLLSPASQTDHPAHWATISW